jgi:hypothetical protein
MEVYSDYLGNPAFQEFDAFFVERKKQLGP